VKITIDVHDASHKLFLTQEGGKGTYGETPFSWYTTIPDGSIIVDLGRGKKKYKVAIADVIEAVFQQIVEEAT